MSIAGNIGGNKGVTNGDAPRAPSMWFLLSKRRILMAMAKAEVVNVILTNLKSK